MQQFNDVPLPFLPLFSALQDRVCALAAGHRRDPLPQHHHINSPSRPAYAVDAEGLVADSRQDEAAALTPARTTIYCNNQRTAVGGVDRERHAVCDTAPAATQMTMQRQQPGRWWG